MFDDVEFILKTPNTLSVKNYILKPNEKIIGDSIVCQKCGETKRFKKYASLYGEDMWMEAKNDGAGLCECEREATRRKVQKENEESFKKNYDCDWLKSLIGKGYAGVHFSDVEKVPNNNLTYQNALNACKSYVDNIDKILKRGYGMYLYSANAGTGKSTLMACLRNGLIERNVRCVFINETDLVAYAKDENSKYDPEGWFDYSLFYTADVLILDDIGVGNLSSSSGAYAEWRNGILYELIEKRNRDNRCTLFTSNYSPEDLNKMRGIDFKTVDRITARSSRIICINANSFRGGNISVGD